MSQSLPFWSPQCDTFGFDITLNHLIPTYNIQSGYITILPMTNFMTVRVQRLNHHIMVSHLSIEWQNKIYYKISKISHVFTKIVWWGISFELKRYLIQLLNSCTHNFIKISSFISLCFWDMLLHWRSQCGQLGVMFWWTLSIRIWYHISNRCAALFQVEYHNEKQILWTWY